MEKALDISRWQDTLDAVKAKAAGITTIICRATYETGKDARWDKFVPAIKAAGIRLGAYGFATWHYRSRNGGNFNTARSLMIKQTDALIALAQAAGVDSWVAVDQELEAGQSLGLSKGDNTTLLIEACERIKAAGLNPCIYCSASWVKANIDTSRCTTPIWAAYYYADPNDPDFEGCTPVTALTSSWGRFMQGLGDQLIGWQFGRIGCGSKYGVGSANVDRDWLYKQPEKEEAPMYTSDTLKIGPASAGDLKSLNNLAQSLGVGVIQDADCLIVGPMSAGDIKTISNQAIALGLPCVDYFPEEQPEEKPEEPEVPEQPENPNVDLTEVLDRLKRIEDNQETIKSNQKIILNVTRAAAEAIINTLKEE